ncbi:hypothetical protein N657DRAFT_93521 [Parathielavia appendiculata]|uniref:Uncharacterized protein n=1 Tax=Parathielavia appendiculata TaxID=2587402 RepID=A0AAN6UBN4_9PEZI|nr:hypothetical protein N657DRAFT_93521 [Parathielavia appendiculata]
MERIPVEPITLIYGPLCPHCQSPNAFPNADTRGQDDLVAFVANVQGDARHCAALRLPLLRHQRVPIIFWADKPGYTYAYGQEQTQFEYDLLTPFLRSIIERPDLARSVQALQLVPSTRFRHRKNPDYWVPIERVSVEFGLLAFNFSHPDYTQERFENRPCALPFEAYEVHHLVEQLAHFTLSQRGRPLTAE